MLYEVKVSYRILHSKEGLHLASPYFFVESARSGLQFLDEGLCVCELRLDRLVSIQHVIEEGGPLCGQHFNGTV